MTPETERALGELAGAMRGWLAAPGAPASTPVTVELLTADPVDRDALAWDLWPLGDAQVIELAEVLRADTRRRRTVPR